MHQVTVSSLLAILCTTSSTVPADPGPIQLTRGRYLYSGHGHGSHQHHSGFPKKHDVVQQLFYCIIDIFEWFDPPYMPSLATAELLSFFCSQRNRRREMLETRCSLVICPKLSFHVHRDFTSWALRSRNIYTGDLLSPARQLLHNYEPFGWLYSQPGPVSMPIF